MQKIYKYFFVTEEWLQDDIIHGIDHVLACVEENFNFNQNSEEQLGINIKNQNQKKDTK